MRISVVTIVLNREETIANSLESLRDQTHKDWEHIVQDGCSTDNTLNIIKQFDDSRREVYSEPDNGIYDALNKAIDKTSGDIIGMLHSDDKLADENVLAAVSSFFDDNPSIDGVYGDLDYVFSFHSGVVFRRWIAGEFKKEKLKYGWMPPHPTVFLRRSVFEKYGTYDPSFRISGDYDAMLRYMMNDVKFGYIKQTLVFMKVGGASNASLKQIYKKSLEDIRAIRRNHAGSLKTVFFKNFLKLSQFRFRKLLQVKKP